MPGISPLDYAAAGITAGTTGQPGVLGMLGIRPMARALILSSPYQARVTAAPSYGPGITGRIGDLITREPVRRLLPGGGAAGSVVYARESR